MMTPEHAVRILRMLDDVANLDALSDHGATGLGGQTFGEAVRDIIRMLETQRRTGNGKTIAMTDLSGALVLSAGNKAKTRAKEGKTLVVSAFFQTNACYWYVGWVNAAGLGDWYGCGGSFRRVEAFAREHGVQVHDWIWLPVELPFPSENGEGAHAE